MKPWTKLYMQAFGYDTSDFIGCEVCGARAVDINHHPARGMGGTNTLDRIECLIAMCRAHHIQYADKKQYVAWLFKLHFIRLQEHGVVFNREWLENEIRKNELD